MPEQENPKETDAQKKNCFGTKKAKLIRAALIAAGTLYIGSAMDFHKIVNGVTERVTFTSREAYRTLFTTTPGDVLDETENCFATYSEEVQNGYGVEELKKAHSMIEEALPPEYAAEKIKKQLQAGGLRGAFDGIAATYRGDFGAYVLDVGAVVEGYLPYEKRKEKVMRDFIDFYGSYTKEEKSVIIEHALDVLQPQEKQNVIIEVQGGLDEKAKYYTALSLANGLGQQMRRKLLEALVPQEKEHVKQYVGRLEKIADNKTTGKKYATTGAP